MAAAVVPTTVAAAVEVAPASSCSLGLVCACTVGAHNSPKLALCTTKSSELVHPRARSNQKKRAKSRPRSCGPCIRTNLPKEISPLGRPISSKAMVCRRLVFLVRSNQDVGFPQSRWCPYPETLRTYPRAAALCRYPPLISLAWLPLLPGSGLPRSRLLMMRSLLHSSTEFNSIITTLILFSHRLEIGCGLRHRLLEYPRRHYLRLHRHLGLHRQSPPVNTPSRPST